MTQREIFFRHLGLPSATPSALHITKSEGIYLYDNDGRKIIDLCAGVSVSNIGHQHPKVVQAVKQQAEQYMHIHVYGELLQTPQVQYAKLLTSQLSEKLDAVYFVNSGSEANEGAIKLAKRFTGRTEIISFKNAYHGSTHGTLSVLGNEYFKQAYRPLLPDVRFLDFNSEEQLTQITEKTACVIIEPVQAEAGVVVPKDNYLQKLRKRCTETGTLLIFDEIQTGFGRVGQLFAHQKFDVTPDILTIAKAMGGGMPIGAFVASREIMDSLKTNPILGHITTFGGHPVSCAAAYANLDVILSENLCAEVDKKGKYFIDNLKHKNIKSITGCGLLFAVELESAQLVADFIEKAEENGFITDAFLFASNKFRIGPPLTISHEQIDEVIELIIKTLDCFG